MSVGSPFIWISAK